MLFCVFKVKFFCSAALCFCKVCHLLKSVNPSKLCFSKLMPVKATFIIPKNIAYFSLHYSVTQDYLEVKWNLPLSISFKEKGTFVYPGTIKSLNLHKYTVLCNAPFTSYVINFCFRWGFFLACCDKWHQQLHNSLQALASICVLFGWTIFNRPTRAEE